MRTPPCPTLSLITTFCLFALPATSALAQGLLVDTRPAHQVRLPRPMVRPVPEPIPGSYKIESLDVNARLIDQVAQVQVSQTFVNTGSRQMEVAFIFPLPYDSAIDGLTLLVDGKEFAGRLLSAEEARRRYEEIVRKNQDPALLEWIGTGMFQTSVFPVPAGAKRTVTLRYSQLCRQADGLTDFLFPLQAAKYTSEPLEKLRIRVSIESTAPIQNVYSATHQVDIERRGATLAVVTHESTNVLPADDFRLFYDANQQGIGASVISYRPQGEDGYFLLLASPSLAAADAVQAAKTVVFVIDRSGSMSGEKLDQARAALKFVLNNLREGDLFNIVAYDSTVESFRPELQRYNDTTRQTALAYADGLYSGGSTDINAALGRAMGMLTDTNRPTYVIFLTDGLPTAGETGEAAIVNNCEQANGVRARLFAFGVGYDVNSRLLDKLARANFGQSEYVRPDEDIEAAVSRLYNRIGAPVLTGVNVEMFSTGVKSANARLSRVFPKEPFDLFLGDQAVVVGRYSNPGNGENKVRLTGTVAGEQRTFEFPADLASVSRDDTNAFVARLWATRRVGEIIDEIDLKGRNEELVKELVDLATRHGILTPYTSFLADETSDIRDVAENTTRSLESVADLSATTGEVAFGQRTAKGLLQRAVAAPASGFGGGLGGALDEAEEQKLLANRGRGAVYFDHRRNKQVAQTTVWNLGRKTFFQKGGRWIDSSITEEEEQQAQKIERYSREYFDLVARYGKEVSKYLAIDEPIMVQLDGQAYQW